MGKAALWTKEFVSISIINLVLAFGFSMMIPTLPTFIKDIGGNDSHIGWVTVVFTIASLLIRPFSGLAIDRFGRKWILFAGLLVMAASTAITSLAAFIAMLLFFRIINGFGFGLASTGSSTLATDIIPKSRFGEGMGYFALTNSIGMAFAPMIGLALMSALGFRWMTIGAAALMVLSFFLATRIKFKKNTHAVGRRAGFAPYDISAARPAIIVFFVCAVFGAVLSFITLYAASVNVGNIGLFFTFNAGALLLTRTLIGRLIDRFGFKTVILPGFVLVIIALFLLSGAVALPMFLISGALLGIGFGMTQTSLQTMAVINAPYERRGAANATFFTGLDGGIGFGSLAAGYMAQAWGYSTMVLSLIIFVIIGLALYLLLAWKFTVSTDGHQPDAIKTKAIEDIESQEGPVSRT